MRQQGAAGQVVQRHHIAAAYPRRDVHRLVPHDPRAVENGGHQAQPALAAGRVDGEARRQLGLAGRLFGEARPHGGEHRGPVQQIDDLLVAKQDGHRSLLPHTVAAARASYSAASVSGGSACGQP
jgi:hypothetical protein